MRNRWAAGARQLRRSLWAVRSRALEDPPSRGGLVLTYVIALAVLAAAVVGGGVLIGLQTWGASDCLASGRPLASASLIHVFTFVVGAIVVAYCLGCSAYLWSVGAASVHSRAWLIISILVAGLFVWAAFTVHAQPCS